MIPTTTVLTYVTQYLGNVFHRPPTPFGIAEDSISAIAIIAPIFQLSVLAVRR